MERPPGGAADEIVQRDFDRGFGAAIAVHLRVHRRRSAGEIVGRTPRRPGAIWPTAAIMLATVSPVMVGADAASPQPTTPSSDSMRTRTLSARATVSPAICTGFFIGRLTAMGSIALIFTTFLDHAAATILPAAT